MTTLFLFKPQRYKNWPNKTSNLKVNLCIIFIIFLNVNSLIFRRSIVVNAVDVDAATEPTHLPHVINGNMTLKYENSPFIINDNLIIARKAKLTIEPGCELRFAKGKQLIVHGTLDARGTHDQRIKFTKKKNFPNSNFYSNNLNLNNNNNDTRSNYFEYTSNLFKTNSFRLVEGETILDGKLQIFYNSKWHYVCSTQFKYVFFICIKSLFESLSCRTIENYPLNYSFF
jgi:hypothetical protein